MSQTGGSVTWDTTCPRRKYVTREWQSRWREHDPEDPESEQETITETERSYVHKSGNPYVVVISPNASDAPVRGVRYDFGSIDADQCFGEGWHMDVVQAVADPYWQAGHRPCAHGGAWEQADQPCGEDANSYPYPPLVEANLASPAGAPAMPAGIAHYPAGSAMPGPVSAPNCSVTPYARPTLHYIRAEWETCADWVESTAHNCAAFPYPTAP